MASLRDATTARSLSGSVAALNHWLIAVTPAGVDDRMAIRDVDIVSLSISHSPIAPTSWYVMLIALHSLEGHLACLPPVPQL